MLITIIIKENVTDRQDRETKALPTTHNYTRVQCTLQSQLNTDSYN